MTKERVRQTRYAAEGGVIGLMAGVVITVAVATICQIVLPAIWRDVALGVVPFFGGVIGAEIGIHWTQFRQDLADI